MTHRDDRNGFEFETQADSASGGFQEILELLAEHGFEGMAHAMQVLLNEAMKLERSHVLGRTALPAHARAPWLCQRLQTQDGRGPRRPFGIGGAAGPWRRVLSVGSGARHAQ